jgi:hypothetical protein
MNRRLGTRRFLKLPDLKALAARVRDVRWPSLSKKNRRKLFHRQPEAPLEDDTADAGEATAATPHGLTGSGARGRLGRVARPVLGFLAWAAPLAAAVVAFTVPLLGVRAYEYVMDSGYFRVREVVVDHAGPAGAPDANGTTRRELRGDKTPPPHHDRAKLLEIAGIDAGTHVLEADLEAMTRRLEADPWIRWAKVERELPDRLVVHVVEHQPSAFLAAGDLYLVDELGVPFALAPADLALTLPVISGIDPDRLTDARESPVIAQELASALNIFRIWGGADLSHRYPVGELRLQPGGAVTLVLEGKATGTATEIVLGRGPFREKLFRVEWILEHLRSVGSTAEYILLDLGDELASTGSPYAGTTDIAGARVVVKADVGHEVPATRPIEDAPRPPDGAAAPVENRTPAARDEGPVTPPSQADDEVGADPEGEAAPVSGGRPALDDGQE